MAKDPGMRPPEPSVPPKPKERHPEYEDVMEEVLCEDPISALADAVAGKAAGAKAGSSRSPDADTVLWVLQCLQSGYQLVPGGLGVES